MNVQGWITGFWILAFGLSVAAEPELQPAPPAFEKTEGTVGSAYDALKASMKHPEPADSSETADTSTQLIQVQVEYVETSQDNVTRMLYPQNPGAAVLRKQLQEMIGRKEATMLETQCVVTKAGRGASTDSGKEVIYPGEEGGSDGLGKPAGEVLQPKLDPSMWAIAPTSFFSRDVGGRLEAAPSLSPDGIIEVTLIANLTWRSDGTPWLAYKDPSGNTTRFQMPDFCRLDTHTQICCVAGRYTLVAIQTPKNAQGEMDLSRKVWVFAKCSVITVK